MPYSDFYSRFNISIDLKESHRRFVNRIENEVFDGFFDHDVEDAFLRETVLWRVAHELGEPYDYDGYLISFTKSDFLKTLHVLEVAYSSLETKKQRKELDRLISFVVDSSEIDLDIRWKNGLFIPQGVKLLDRALVDDNLKWLSDPKYLTVRQPFEKAIRNFMSMRSKPDLGSDVVADLYKSLESLSKIVTNRTSKDLSANLESLIKQMGVTTQFRPLLKEYITYANAFRHGSASPHNFKNPSFVEVESFLYLTGLFIRISIQSAAA